MQVAVASAVPNQQQVVPLGMHTDAHHTNTVPAVVATAVADVADPQNTNTNANTEAYANTNLGAGAYSTGAGAGAGTGVAGGISDMDRLRLIENNKREIQRLEQQNRQFEQLGASSGMPK
jgi:hypothetical protein